MRLEIDIFTQLIIHFFRFLALSLLVLAGYIFYHGFQILLVYLVLFSGLFYGASAIIKSLRLKSKARALLKPDNAYRRGSPKGPEFKLNKVIELNKVKDEAAQKDPIIKRFLNLISSDETLISPVFCRQIKSETNAENARALPLIYIWNEDRQTGTFTLSVNGEIVMKLLETLCGQNDPKFIYRRDEIIRILSDNARDAVVKACQREGCLPSDIY